MAALNVVYHSQRDGRFFWLNVIFQTKDLDDNKYVQLCLAVQ